MVEVIEHVEQRAGAPRIHWRDPMQKDGADARLREVLTERAAERSLQAAWQPTLAGNDLACLLQVIQAELLPRLLGDYRPADQSPLKATRSG